MRLAYQAAGICARQAVDVFRVIDQVDDRVGVDRRLGVDWKLIKSYNLLIVDNANCFPLGANLNFLNR